MRIVAVVLGLLVLAGAFWAWTIWSVYFAGGKTDIRPPEDDAPIEVIDMGDGFSVLSGAGGNITLLEGEDAILLVDTGFPNMSAGVVAAVQSVSDKPVRFIINTHSHGDHSGGNAALAGPETEIIAHSIARDEMSAFLGAGVESEGIPTTVFDGSFSFEFADQTISLTHVPGAHSISDVLVEFQPANIIAAGDAFMTTGLPYLAVEQGASADGHLNAQAVLIALTNADTRIIPGHGDLADQSNLLEINSKLQRIRNRIKWLKDMGVPKKLRVLFHPVQGWPKELQSDGDWEKYWSALVWDSLP